MITTLLSKIKNYNKAGTIFSFSSPLLTFISRELFMGSKSSWRHKNFSILFLLFIFDFTNQSYKRLIDIWYKYILIIITAKFNSFLIVTVCYIDILFGPSKIINICNINVSYKINLHMKSFFSSIPMAKFHSSIDSIKSKLNYIKTNSWYQMTSLLIKSSWLLRCPRLCFVKYIFM